MPFPKATPPKLPATNGAITLTVTTNAAGEPVIGKASVQVLDGSGAGYEKQEGALAQVLSAATLLKVQEAIDAVRTQADGEILT